MRAPDEPPRVVRTPMAPQNGNQVREPAEEPPEPTLAEQIDALIRAADHATRTKAWDIGESADCTNQLITLIAQCPRVEHDLRLKQIEAVFPSYTSKFLHDELNRIRKLRRTAGLDVDAEPAVPVPTSPTSLRTGYTDLGNAELLIEQHGAALRYCTPMKTWLIWDGKRHKPDDIGAIYRLAKGAVVSLYAEAAEISDKDDRQAIIKHATDSESERALNAMVALAAKESGIPVLPGDLDSEPWVLNVLNGTLVLGADSVGLRAHDPADLITKLIPIAYDPTAPCPVWDRFLQEIFAQDQTLIDFVQRAVGYSLTGDTSEQCFFVLWGLGSNGKTTLLRALGAVWGEYGCATRPETFMVKKGDAIPNDVAALRGARFVTATEAERGHHFAEALVKQMTGGDLMTARFMRAEFFTFVPRFKLFLATNHKPLVQGTDHAFWRRVKLIPFTVTIPDADQDKGLLAKLWGERAGILRWAVAGYGAWRRLGLGAPQAVLAATADYRQEMDRLGDFLTGCCELGAGLVVPFGELWRAYDTWCRVTEERPVSRKTFATMLTERGCAPDVGSKGVRLRKGLRLRAEVRLGSAGPFAQGAGS